jgi:hypothetical protein
MNNPTEYTIPSVADTEPLSIVYWGIGFGPDSETMIEKIHFLKDFSYWCIHDFQTIPLRFIV